MGYFLCGHGGSGDHGSEDRIRGTCRVLPEEPDLYSASPEEDWKYGLADLAGLYRQTPGTLERQLRPGDILLTTRPGRAIKNQRGVGTVLWGWSAGGTTLPRQTLRELGQYSALVVPDSRSLETLETMGLRNVRLGPDPAFLVERVIRPLGGAFRRDTVGLCLSPCSCRFENGDGLLFRSYCGLIRCILEETSFQIALIPYCVQPRRNDCLLLTALERQFQDCGRVFCRKDGDCRVLRGDISLCRCLVGAAGAVAAWSCGVPALCLGANARSVGLAMELFDSWQEAVVPIASLKAETDLTRRFRRFLTREDRHRRQLETAVPLRRQQSAEWKWCV